MAKEARSSVGYGVRERLATRDVSEFNIAHTGTRLAAVRKIQGLNPSCMLTISTVIYSLGHILLQ